jgi:hypothetical protein
MTQHAGVAIFEALHVLLQQARDRLLESDTNEAGLLASLERLRRLLEALPLATDEFGLAVNRLENARRYLLSGEYGAGCFELRLLLQSLER